jgi:hypothetical protein
MNSLATLLSRLSADGLSLALRGEQIGVTPAVRLTPELRDDIVHHRSEIIELLRFHGSNLVALFANAPTWPPPRGRDGAANPDLWQRVGEPVRLHDGRSGDLRAISYSTHTGRLRLRIDFPDGWALVDPEDLQPATDERRSA